MFACPLTQNQIEIIVKTINYQCYRYQKREKEYFDLHYEPYTCYRSKHHVTAAILSGFTPEKDIDGFDISVVHYGKNKKMGQPELKNTNVILHIYNTDCGFSSIPFKQRCKKFNANLPSQPMFCCIVFSATSTGFLNSIELKIPNAEGKFVQSFLLFRQSRFSKIKKAQ